VNSRSSTVAPLPIAAFFARSISTFSSPAAQSSSADASAGSSSGCTDDDPSCIKRATAKRQVDPLHSCIEAKCSSWNSGNYLDCVYRHCVSGFQMNGKRSTDGDDTFGHPEGRFLLLPVAFQSSGVEPFLPDAVRSDDKDEEERSARMTRARLTRRRVSALLKGGHHHGRRAALDIKHDRTKRSVPAWNDGASPVDVVRRGSPLVARLRAAMLPKRSYNDIADVCVEHHCGQLSPHTISYFQCVDQHCTGKRI